MNKNLQNSPLGNIVKFPIQRIHVELTNICNFDCTFCPKSVMTRPTGFMDKNLAFKIIDEIVDNNIAKKLTFHIMGEPMMHPDFFEIIDYCESRKIDVGITTNGSFLKGKRAALLVKKSISQINISLQTPDDQSFKLRKPGFLGLLSYLTQVIDFIRLLKENNSKTVIKIHFLNTHFNKMKGKDFQDISVISDNDTLRSVFSEWVEKIYSIDGIGDSEQKNKVLNGLKKITVNRWNVLEIAPDIFLETYLLNTWGNAFTGKIVPSNFGYCTAMKDHFGILHDGNLILCCKDFDGKTSMGNVKERSIIDIITSDRVLDIVKGFGKFKVKHSYCKKCLGGETPSSALINQLGSAFFLKLVKWYFYNTKVLY